MELYLATLVRESFCIYFVCVCFWSVARARLLICADCFVSVYDVSGAASDRNCVVLSDIHIDIMDYIQPASCTDAEFRQMWAEFEWENKVSFACVLSGQFPKTDRLFFLFSAS